MEKPLPGQEGPFSLYQGTSESFWLPPPKSKLVMGFWHPTGEGRAESGPGAYTLLVPSALSRQDHSSCAIWV